MDAAEYLAVFKYGGMPLETAKRSIELFAKEVLPHIQRGTSPQVQSAAAGGRESRSVKASRRWSMLSSHRPVSAAAPSAACGIGEPRPRASRELFGQAGFEL
jgi:hypothetical protein